MAAFLANENVPGDAVAAARKAGHDVTWIKEVLPGASDEAVLDRSVAEHRVLVTFDKDFGELAFRRGRAASAPTASSLLYESVRADSIWA